jgi:hypothetical protein
MSAITSKPRFSRPVIASGIAVISIALVVLLIWLVKFAPDDFGQQRALNKIDYTSLGEVGPVYHSTWLTLIGERFSSTRDGSYTRVEIDDINRSQPTAFKTTIRRITQEGGECSSTYPYQCSLGNAVLVVNNVSTDSGKSIGVLITVY